jgi:hypothetical protein
MEIFDKSHGGTEVEIKFSKSASAWRSKNLKITGKTQINKSPLWRILAFWFFPLTPNKTIVEKRFPDLWHGLLTKSLWDQGVILLHCRQESTARSLQVLLSNAKATDVGRAIGRGKKNDKKRIAR